MLDAAQARNLVPLGRRANGLCVFGCDHLVIAAGPQTARFAAMLRTEFPMVPARAEMIVTEPLPLMPIGGVDDNGLYGRQTLLGNLAHGGGPHEGADLDDLEGCRPQATPPCPASRCPA